MRRFFILLLMFVLPLQWSWSAAAAICAHEAVAEAAPTHFGHHTHEHADDGAEAASTTLADDGQASVAAEHVDCGVCHLSCSLMVPSVRFAGFGQPEPERHARVGADVPHRSVETPFRPPLVAVV